MENKFKDHLVRLNSERIILSNSIDEIMYPYLVSMDEHQMIDFGKIPVEKRTQLDTFSGYVKSTDFKLNCIFETFPELIDDGYSRIGSDISQSQEFMILPDFMDIKTKQNYLEIAGKMIECKDKMTKSEYQHIFNSKIKEMLQNGELTPEMIADSKNYYTIISQDIEEVVQRKNGPKM